MKRVPLRCPAALVLAGLAVVFLTASRAAPNTVQELRIQKVGDVTYFHVRLEAPRELMQDRDRLDRGFLSDPSPSLAPRLLGSDDQVRLVCQRFSRAQRDRFGGPGRDVQ